MSDSDREDGADAGSDPDADGDSAIESSEVAVDPAFLAELFAVIEQRRETLPADSYTASLFTHEKGRDAVLEKLGEETTELILAAKDDDPDAITAETADLLYHLLVLLAAADLDLAAVLEELAARHG